MPHKKTKHLHLPFGRMPEIAIVKGTKHMLGRHGKHRCGICHKYHY